MSQFNSTSPRQPGDSPSAHGIKTYAWYIIAAWTLLLLASSVLTYIEHKNSITSLAQMEARTVIDRDVLYRSWSSSHGGVYATVTAKNPPNPYLSQLPERDITTPSGRELTLINPAYMTRQIYELAKESGTFRGSGHLTSLNPLRLENTPDPWERKALEAFEHGEREASEILTVKGEPAVRLMRAFVTEESCLKCHAIQGYKVGDVRGGLSMTLPLQPLIAATSKQVFSSQLTHLLIWLLGLGMIGFAARQMVRRARSQYRAENQLAASLSMLNATLESTADGVLVTDLSGRISRWNQKFVDLWHIPQELMTSQEKYPVTQHIAAQMTEPEEFFEKVLTLYNNIEVSSIDDLQLADGRCFRRFSQPQKIGAEIVGRVWSFDDITEQKRAEQALEDSNRKLEILSLTDGLTGVANRRRFDAMLTLQHAVHTRSGAELSIILLDIDHFKAFNDCYGHVAGDECLRQVGKVIAANTTRPTDLAARYGGEEFACILPETDARGAIVVAEKIRHKIAALAIPHEGSDVAAVVTASFGVLTLRCAAESTTLDILSQVDALLYRAKSNGRNRVEHANPIKGVNPKAVKSQ